MKDIQKFLKETQKPEFKNSEHKNQLRRALLNSKELKKKKSVWTKVLIPLSAGSILAAVIVAVVFYNSPKMKTLPGPNPISIADNTNSISTDNASKIDDQTQDEAKIGSIRKFRSVEEIKRFLERNQTKNENDESFEIAMVENSQGSIREGQGGGMGETAVEFSTTNVQEKNVDEADIVKNDGKYIYASSKNKVSIFEAYPADKMKKLSEINVPMTTDYYETEPNLFLNDESLAVIVPEYTTSFKDDSNNPRCTFLEKCPSEYQEEKTVVYIYDIKDRKNPTLRDTIRSTGYYVDSRMINDFLYIVTTQDLTHGIILPAVEKNGFEKIVLPQEIFYDNESKDARFQYSGVLAINIKNGNTNQQVTLAGHSEEIYVSENNIYTTKQLGDYFGTDDNTNKETVINRISIDKDKINYEASGKVSGWIDDQFSLDEYKDNLRVTTTVKEYNNDNELTNSRNYLYVLDKELKMIGSLEMAPGEEIYSTRFAGDRGYVVTFKEVDPLFVVDLKNPKKPYVLGELKIPGYSEYLHPYDENHLIGIGHEAAPATIENFKGEKEEVVLSQGIKMAIFDVTDLLHPKEMFTEVIGDRGTESEATIDHHTFLFDKKKELLVIPITLKEIQGEKTSNDQYGDTVLTGAIVYRINLEKGFKLEGKITHFTPDETARIRNGEYIEDYQKAIRRIIFMDNYLFTLSRKMIKANKLWSLDEINSSNL